MVKPSPEKVDPEILVPVIEEDLQDLGEVGSLIIEFGGFA